MNNLIYVEVKGTNVIVDGKHGRVTALHHSPIDSSVDGAFIAWDQGGMAYATTGRIADERGAWREIESVRTISRDEFDVLSGISRFRAEMGWVAA